jgi:hypothetical protein
VKSLLIIFFVALVAFSFGQKSKVVYPYINQVLYPKAVTHVDSFKCNASSAKNLTVSLINKGFTTLMLDSIKCTDSCAYLFYSFTSKAPFFFEIYDEKGNVLQKSHFTKNAYNKFLNLTDKLIQYQENRGYPFTQIVLDSIKNSNQKNMAYYSLHPKLLIRFDSLDIIGKINISNKFMCNYTGIVPQKIYNEKKVRQLDNRLKELLFIKSQKSSDMYFLNDKAKARLYLTKNSANQFDGLVGMQTDDKQKVQLTGDVSLVLKNTFKHADDVSVQWKKLSGTSQTIDLSLSYPYIFSYPIGYFGQFSLLKQDSSYVNTNLKTGVFFYTSGFNGVLIYYEQRQSSVLATSQISSTNPAHNFTTKMMGVSYHYASLDNIILPQKGINFTFSTSYGNKVVQKSSTIPDSVYNNYKHEQMQCELSNVAYIPIKYPFFLKAKILGGYIDNVQFISEEFRVGGSQTIRGFDEESIYTSNHVLLSIEPRFVIDRSTQLYVFYDALWYKSIQVKSDTPWGIGVGTDFYTKAGVFYVSYALGSQNNQPLLLRNAKIHFGYRNRF